MLANIMGNKSKTWTRDNNTPHLHVQTGHPLMYQPYSFSQQQQNPDVDSRSDVDK
jgi:hypothetical protein